MGRFHCGRFPHGEVPIRTREGLVVFHGGQADVDDDALAAALRDVDPVFAITEEPSQTPPPAPPGDGGPGEGEAPSPDAVKADWIAWAVRQGAGEAEAKKLTKSQLVEQYGRRDDPGDPG